MQKGATAFLELIVGCLKQEFILYITEHSVLFWKNLKNSNMPSIQHLYDNTMTEI